MNDFLLRMKSLLGDEFDEFLKFYNSDDFIKGLRVNTLKCLPEKLCSLLDFELKKTPFCDEGFYIPSDVKSIGNNPLHHAGAFYVQEPSATSAVTMLDVHEGDYVLDLCAAPGGKSTQIGAKLNGTGLLWSNEIVRSRANILLSNIERMGISNAVVSNCRPDELCKRLENRFDRILVDAPCSGEGMFRKEPQAVDEWSVEHTVSCGVRQKHILDCAMKMLKGGGYIVYSTCTFAPEENEQVCTYMLENYNVELVEPNNLDMLSKGRGEWSNSDYDMSKTRRIFPHKNNGEGHFVALFHSLDNYESEVSKPKKTSMTDAEKVYRQFEKEFLNTELDGEFCLFGEQLYLKPKCIDVDKIKVVRNGLNLGIYRKNRFEPSYALCLALKKEDFKNTVDFECDSEELKKYLMGNTVECDKKGWCAVTVNGYPIGWGKASNGILKNHFPKYLRLKR